MRRLSAGTATGSTCARVGPALTFAGTNPAVVPIAARPATDTATGGMNRRREEQRWSGLARNARLPPAGVAGSC